MPNSFSWIQRRNVLWVLWAAGFPAFAQEAALIRFETQEVDDQVQIGYGVALGDVDGDGKPDLILADKRAFVWYRNPTWERYVLAESLTEHDNVCVAARDINGDGKVEIAVGAQWNPGDTVNSGAVFYLEPPEDRRQRWRPIALHHEPVVHRMRWVRGSDDQFVLVVSPLHGRGNRNGEGEGARLLAYQPPASVLRNGQAGEELWPITVLHDSFHVTHNFDVGQWNPATAAEEVLHLGREGGVLLEHGTAWTSRTLERVQGGGEIRMGAASDGRRWISTIEPFHGERLAVYYADQPGGVAFSGGETLADNFNQGHAIAVADLGGDAGHEIVAGWRNPNRDGDVGLKLFHHDQRGWRWQWIDRNGMATEDARIADLNQDGRPDVVAAGRSTRNLRIYWNRGQ